MENYIVINGKKAELTEEQLKALGIEIEDPFELKYGEYFYINPSGEVIEDYNSFGCVTTKYRYNVANYCVDKELMEKRALHENLSRMLWRYSMQHDGDKISYGDSSNKYYIYFHNGDINLPSVSSWSSSASIGKIFFYSESIAEAAIEIVVKPFMKAHPNFKW